MNNPSSIIVDVAGVTKQYPKSEKAAVSGLDFSFPKGAIFGLLGPNGAGKSTLIAMICGLLKPDHGKISVLGLDSAKEGESIRKKIGVAPQDIALYPTLTAQENLNYFAKMYGQPSHESAAAIEKYLDTFGLSSNRNRQVRTFSGGMKRRLNLIAALLHQPALIILDEPTSGVDVQSRNLILDFLLEIQKQGVTIMYSSHYLEEAERICSRILIIDEGKRIAEGSPGELLNGHADCRNLEDVFLKLTGKHIRD